MNVDTSIKRWSLVFPGFSTRYEYELSSSSTSSITRNSSSKSPWLRELYRCSSNTGHESGLQGNTTSCNLITSAPCFLFTYTYTMLSISWQVSSVWDDELNNVVQMGLNSTAPLSHQDLTGIAFLNLIENLSFPFLFFLHDQRIILMHLQVLFLQGI